jgi:hypothetical protein
MAQSAEKNFQKANYGLRREILSPMETLAQSVSTMAPTTTPAATIPLVCALAGNGTWLAYVLATAAVLLVALCIARYPAIRRRPVRSTPMHHRLCQRGFARPSRGVSC